MPGPNILLVHSDQHRYDCLGATGHPLIRTPHMDCMAREGVLFTHAFTPCPLCVPSRNSLLFGQWPSQHRAIGNQHTEIPFPARDGLPSFSQALRDGGYYLGYVGKWGVHPARKPTDFGFHDYVPADGYERWRAGQGLPPAPHDNGWFGEADPHVAPEQSRMGWGADVAIRLHRAAADAGRPFFIRWDPSGPHLPNVVPEPYASMYAPRDIPPWPSFPDPLVGKPFIQAQQRRTWELDGWTWEQWAPVVSRYLGDVSLMDAQLGRVLQALDESGLADDTLVAYTCDHGDTCGGHGMIDKHYIMYDDVVRVPLILRWPRRLPAGGRCDGFTAHALDLAATFCDAAAVPMPGSFRGASLLPMALGQVRGGTDAFSCYFGGQFGLYSQRMVRDRRWKYVWNATAEDELYDLTADPAELHNLAAEPATRTELQRLRHRLVERMEATDDMLLNQWTRAQLLEGLK
ncbi:MAG: sulfatase-like hydrolase/transferase [Anaerolineae bacterium]